MFQRRVKELRVDIRAEGCSELFFGQALLQGKPFMIRDELLDYSPPEIVVMREGNNPNFLAIRDDDPPFQRHLLDDLLQRLLMDSRPQEELSCHHAPETGPFDDRGRSIFIRSRPQDL